MKQIFFMLVILAHIQLQAMESGQPFAQNIPDRYLVAPIDHETADLILDLREMSEKGIRKYLSNHSNANLQKKLTLYRRAKQYSNASNSKSLWVLPPDVQLYFNENFDLVESVPKYIRESEKKFIVFSINYADISCDDKQKLKHVFKKNKIVDNPYKAFIAFMKEDLSFQNKKDRTIADKIREKYASETANEPCYEQITTSK